MQENYIQKELFCQFFEGQLILFGLGKFHLFMNMIFIKKNISFSLSALIKVEPKNTGL